MRANQVQWTSERVELLHKKWSEGATVDAIAASLGITRSAVAGKIFRLRRAAPLLHPSALARRRPSKRTDRPKKVTKPRRTSVLELHNTSCRWPRENRRPSAGIFFCGGSGADLERGRPYCALHMALAYSTPCAVE
jgi:hypothetical protein